MNSKTGREKSDPKPKYGLFEFVLGGLFCVGVPALMTAMAPVSWLELRREGQQVNATVQTCIFFVIPYRTKELTDVRSVDSTVRVGQRVRDNNHKEHTPESEGMLTLQSGNAESKLSISVSPASIDAVKRQVSSLIEDKQQTKTTLFTVANWKFGLIFAIPVCLLTVLYVVGWSIWLGQTLAKPFQILRVDEPHESDEAGGEQANQ